MIVKGKKLKRNRKDWMLPLTLLLLLVGALLIKAGIANRPSNQLPKSAYYCSAETVKGDNFITDGNTFGGGKTQTADYARTGKYACKLDENNDFGFSLKLDNLQPGKTYKAEVWRHVRKPIKSFLVVSAEDAEQFYGYTDTEVEGDGAWWQRMEYIFTVPQHKTIKTWNIYVYKEKGDGVILFDDFSLRAINDDGKYEGEAFKADDFHIKIDKEGLDKLIEVKERAFTQGVLLQTDEDRVQAKVTTNDGLKKAKVRLKGDWLDHIFNGKSSFRIQLGAEDSWKGMQVFSVQHPSTRGMLREWVYHEFLNYVGVLSPRYDFINFHYNDQNPVIYAYEEHFTKNLVENQLKREGPIIKFTEDRFWEGMSRSLQGSRKMAEGSNKEKALWSAEIKPFKEKKTASNPTLEQSFTIAQNLMQQYRYGLKKPSDIFDIELMAKYMAITDLLQAEHTFTWHNQRFYFNPITNLLEPIGFDGFGGDSPENPNAPLYAEYMFSHQGFSSEPIDRLFYDAEFMGAYVDYLLKYTEADFIKKFLAAIEEPLTARETFLQQDYKGYTFNRENVLKRSLRIRESIIPFTNSLQVFTQERVGDSTVLNLSNEHILPLEVIYIGKNKVRQGSQLLENTLVFPTRQGELPNYTTIKAPSWATKVHYRLVGLDSTFVADIPIWKIPNNWSPRQELLKMATAQEDKPYTEKDDLILFEKKTYDITKPLVLPKGKRVVFQPGTHLKFSKEGFLLSFSAIEMRGDEDEPIMVESLDGQSGSFTVMQAEYPSMVRHVLFKNQNTLAYKGWNLTGAVTFYESDVKVFDTRFINNQCEDALNIVRSTFEVRSCGFQGIYGDAFDADFCEGLVQRCAFKNIGNDALDFSTSVIDIENCKMDEVGDKAISAGEAATITATDIEVNKANIGFASKDKSVLTLDRVQINNSSKGFTAYQKKPEYGGATIDLRAHTLVDVKYPFLIEGSSVLKKN